MSRSLRNPVRYTLVGLVALLLLTLACAQGGEEAAAPSPAATPAPVAAPAAAPAAAPSAATAAPAPAPAPAPTGVQRPAFAGPRAMASDFSLRADRPRPAPGAENEKGVQFMVQYGANKLPIWTKANYGGQAVFSGGVTQIHLNPFKYIHGARSTFGGTFMTFDNGRCSLQGKADMTTCDGTRAEIYVGVLLPGVFERWEQPTPTSYLFHVNKRAMWPAIPPMNRTDRAVTAADVVWYFETMKNGGISALTFELTDTIEAVDRSTVKVTMKEAQADFVRMLSTASMAIIPKECYDEKGCLEQKFISPGPFLLKEFQLRGPAFFEKNPEFHIKGVPWLDSWRALPFPDFASSKAAFITGKIDFLSLTRPSESLNMEKERPGAQLIAAISINGLLHHRIQLKGPLADVRVRRALVMGVDWPLAWEAHNEGFALPATQISYEHLGLTLPPAMKDSPYYNQFDPAGARKLLAEAGYPNGFEITLQHGGACTGWCEINLAMQDQWKRNLNVTARILSVDSATHTKSLYEGTWKDMWYAVCYIGGSCAAPDAEGTLLQEVSWSPQNLSKVNDPIVDDYFRKIRGEMDPVKRKDLLWKYQLYTWNQVYTFSMGNPLGFQILQPWELNATFHSYLWLGGPNGSTWTHMFDLTKFPSR